MTPNMEKKDFSLDRLHRSLCDHGRLLGEVLHKAYLLYKIGDQPNPNPEEPDKVAASDFVLMNLHAEVHQLDKMASQINSVLQETLEMLRRDSPKVAQDTRR